MGFDLMPALETFCRQVRSRSRDNREAMAAVRDVPSQMVAILRQELDSLVRIVFLLAQEDRTYRQELIEASVEGRLWMHPGTKRRVTDREMVDVTSKLHGWTKSVYDFGCAFIHLSRFHDHEARDPFAQISTSERDAILKHLRYYHGGPTESDPTFADVVPLLPAVFEKIASNLECYISDVEKGKGGRTWLTGH